MNNELVIVDYGVGNLGSIVNMLRRLDVTPVVSSDPGVIESARRLILPGVGAFGFAMSRLQALGLVDPLRRQVNAGTPLLGICLGMQLFARRSEEGDVEGFGWLEAETIRFRADANLALRIPHMGWNDVDLSEATGLEGLEGERRYYFAHSYHLVCHDPAVVLGSTTYGYTFPSIVGRGNLLGVQFHPEKSHKYGMALLRSFLGGVRWDRTGQPTAAAAGG